MLMLMPGALCAAESSYPTRPIRFVVPFPPGGGADTLARVIGQKLALELGQQIVVDNRGGAGGLLGTEIVARAAPDGYTLPLGTVSTHGSNPNLYKKLPYDPVRDFAPVILLAVVPNILMVHPAVPARSVKELIALAKQKPGALNYASVGVGSAQHLIFELFNKEAQINIVHVPYKGTGPAFNDLLAGQVQMMFTNLITSIPHLKSNRLRGVAVTGAKRTSVLPDIPAVAEVLPGFSATSWYGLLAPAQTSRAIVEKLNRSVAVALKSPEISERLAADGAEPGGGSADQFQQHIKAEMNKYALAVKAAGILPE